MITAIGHNRWIAHRAAAEERDRQRRDLSESDEPLVFLRKLIAKDVVPKGQIFPTVSIEKGELRQTVLATIETVDGKYWVAPQASIRSAGMGKDIEWDKIEQALESATDPSGVKALVDILEKQPKEIGPAWQGDPIINKPALWPSAELSMLRENLPLLYRE